MLCRTLCALLFVAWTAEWPLEYDRTLYYGYWRSPFEVLGPLFVPVPPVNLSPWQLLIFALAPLCLLRPGAFRGRAAALDAAILISLASIAVTFIWGLMRGGSAYNAYYQLWRFLLALLVGLMLVSATRTPRDLKAIGVTVLAAALVRATLCVYFYWTVVHGRIDPPPPHMTSHDDSLLFVAGLVIVVSWALERGRLAAWLWAASTSILFVNAITLNNRRLAWIELLLALALVYVVLPRGRVKRRVTQGLMAAAPVLLVYVVAGWGRPGAMFEPLRALATAGSDADSSSLARQEEIRNLLYTLSSAGNPLLGTGWGLPYHKVTSVYANFGPEWWQYAYMPHNSLLALAAFGGLVGIGGIWIVVPTAALLAMRGYRGSTHPAVRAGAMSAVCVLPAYGVQCYGDIGIQSLTCGLLLGVAMAVSGKASVWAAGSRRHGGGRGHGPLPPIVPRSERCAA